MKSFLSMLLLLVSFAAFSNSFDSSTIESKEKIEFNLSQKTETVANSLVIVDLVSEKSFDLIAFTSDYSVSPAKDVLCFKRFTIPNPIYSATSIDYKTNSDSNSDNPNYWQSDNILLEPSANLDRSKSNNYFRLYPICQSRQFNKTYFSDTSDNRIAFIHYRQIAL